MKNNSKINTDIVIIDTGVNTDHPLFFDKKIKGISFKQDECGVIKTSDDIYDNIGHGTAIYNIIMSNNKNVDIYIIKIFNDKNPLQDEKVFHYALQYILDNISCKIINMSLGLTIPKNIESLHDICKKITDKGFIIVSAFDNAGAISYPAAFKNIIGVTSGHNCYKNSDIEYYNNDIVNLGAKGRLQRLAWTYPKYIMNSGNSFACAHVTSIIEKLIRYGNKTIEEILLELKNCAKITYEKDNENDSDNKPILNKYKKAILFPFNKEIHSLLRFRRLTPFSIVDVYDIKYSGNVGSSVNKLLNIEDNTNYFIKNINNIEWNSFDTLILGHTDQINELIGEELVNNLIHESLNHGKNIYSFDYIINKENFYKTKQLFSPNISSNKANILPDGKLYRISKPVLAVLGTSSKQGKFTLQLLLREKLSNLEYNVGQIGSEPSSFLFKMDECYHYGYNAQNSLNSTQTIISLNKKIHEISQKNVDIILVGGQSGTIIEDFANINNYTLSQIDFLLGIQPDAVILCINPFDEIEVIDRTIKMIESIVNCKVIGLVMFPMDLKEDWWGIHGKKEKIDNEKFNFCKNLYEEKWNIELYNLDTDSDIDRLTNTAIEFFSE